MDSSLEGKDRYDALYQLSEQAWRDWDHKARHQWRLSFGIWGAQLAATSVVVTGHVEVPLLFAMCVIAAVFIIHLLFMTWIEVRIRHFRRQMYTYVKEMETIVRVSSDGLKRFKEILDREKQLSSCRKKLNLISYSCFAWLVKPAALVQLLITVLLAVVFLMASTSVIVKKQTLPKSSLSDHMTVKELR